MSTAMVADKFLIGIWLGIFFRSKKKLSPLPAKAELGGVSFGFLWKRLHGKELWFRHRCPAAAVAAGVPSFR